MEKRTWTVEVPVAVMTSERVSAPERHVPCPCGAFFIGPAGRLSAFVQDHAACGLELPCPECDHPLRADEEAAHCQRCGVHLMWPGSPLPSVM